MRILFVAMGHSVHSARWINQVIDQGWDVHLFPVPVENEPWLHSEFRHITVHDFPGYTYSGLDSSVSLVYDLLPSIKGPLRLPLNMYRGRRAIYRLKPEWDDRAWRLAQTIEKLQPDIIHSLGMHTAGNLVLQAKSYYEGRFPIWIVSNWGSDIYLFGHMTEHAENVKKMLKAADYYTCECHRDIGLAREFGFEGKFLPVLPVAGGFDFEKAQQLRQPGPTSQRRLITLKGYQGVGRALVGLRAIELCADILKGYRVGIYSAGIDVRIAHELVARSTGIPISIIPFQQHDDMLRMHGEARISIGLSISDGISTSLLEAMLMGSFPIQSNTSCGNEWIKDGETGILVPPNDPEVVAAAIRRAILDDGLVDHAAEVNTETGAARLSSSVIKPQVVDMYQRIANQTW